MKGFNYDWAALVKERLRRTIEQAAAEQQEGQALRNRKLPAETVLRFLIGAEGGSLAKELHRAGINATPAASFTAFI